MAFKDILLVLITYPQATDASEIQKAVSFAVALDARISALACIVQVRAPSQHLLSDAFVAALVASEREKSSVAAAELSAAFEASAKKAGVFQETLTKECFTSDAPDLLAREARMRDLTILPAVLEGHELPMVRGVDRLWFRAATCNTSSARTYSRVRPRHCCDCMGWKSPSRSRSC